MLDFSISTVKNSGILDFEFPAFRPCINLVSANKLRLELDKQSEPFKSRILKFVTADGGHYIATMLVGNNIALVIYSIAFAALLNPLFQTYFQSDSLILLMQTIVSTMIILVFAEFLPKTLFRLFPNFLLNIFSLPLAFFYIIFYPITSFSISITNLLLRKVFKTDPKQVNKNPVFSRIDLDEFVKESEHVITSYSIHYTKLYDIKTRWQL